MVNKFLILGGILFLAVQISAQTNRLIDPFDYPSVLALTAMKTDAPVTTPVTATMPSLADTKYFINFVTYVYGKYDTNTDDWSCEACGSNVTLVSVSTNRLANTLAIINLNQERREIVVTFRGSVNLGNYVLNGELIPIRANFSGGNDKIKVHGGFLIMTKSLYGQIETTLQNLTQTYQGYRLVFVGHSLGAPLAVLTALQIRSNPEFRHFDFSIFAYGSPRIGNKDFADYVNTLNVTIVRAVNKGDLVTHVPARFVQPVYIHHSNQVWITEDGSVRNCSCDVYEDPTCSNLLGPNYSLTDHTTGYFGTNFVTSVTDNWCPFLMQILVNLPPVFNINPCNYA